MVIKRKSAYPLEDSTGSEYPEACIAARTHTYNHQHQELEIFLNVFVNQAKFDEGKASLPYVIPSLAFTKTNVRYNFSEAAAVIEAIMNDDPNKNEIIRNGISFGKGDTEYVVADMLDLEDNCNPQNDMAKLWLMEQPDHEGLPMFYHWELIDENGPYDYYNNLLTFLTNG